MAEHARHLEGPSINFQDVPYRTIVELTKMSVGYNIIDSDSLTENGVPVEIVDSLEADHLQEKGGLRIVLSGVRGYDLLNRICDDLEISKESFFESPANRAIDLRENIFGAIEERMEDLSKNPFLENVDLKSLDSEQND